MGQLFIGIILIAIAAVIGWFGSQFATTGYQQIHEKYFAQKSSVLEGLTPDDVRKIIFEEQINLPSPPSRDFVNAEETSPISAQFALVKGDVDVFYAEAENAYKDGNYFKALKYYEKAVRLIELPVIRIALGSTLITIGEYKKAIEQANIAIEHIESIPIAEREESKAQIHNLKGIAYLEDREYQSAEENFLTSLQYRKELAEDRSEKELQDLGGAYINLAIAEQRLEKFSQSLENLGIALEIFKELYQKNPSENVNFLAMTYYNIASYHNSWGDGERLQKATDNYKEAKELYEQSGNLSGIVACLINLGTLGKQNADIMRLVQMGMPIKLPVSYDQQMERSNTLFSEAIQILTKSSEIESTHNQDLGSVFDTYGVFLMDWKKYTDSEHYLKKAVEIKRPIAKSDIAHSFISLSGSLINLGKLYTIQKNIICLKNSMRKRKIFLKKLLLTISKCIYC